MYICKECIERIITEGVKIEDYFSDRLCALNHGKCERCSKIKKVDWINLKDVEEWKKCKNP